MGKSSAAGKQDVVEYRMSIHFGMAIELDAVTGIYVDDKTAWEGEVTENTALSINLPDLYGGQKKEGGLVGTVQILMGREDQVLPAAAASRYGRTPENCVAFRGITTLMFHGGSRISTGRPGEYDDYGLDWNAGVAANDGFMWKMNSPLLAQKVQFAGRRAPKGLSPENAMIGVNANPAHIIYECLTNDEWGMGGAAALIDADQFEAEGLRLKAENFGLTLWWINQTSIEDFITEILDHIQATLFVNPNTGLLSIKLLRDDYDLETLRHITPDNAVLSNFKRRSAGEIINEISVTYTNPVNEEEVSVTGQDIASIASQGGEKVSASRNYYAIRDPELAAEVLARDLRASTAPLVSAEAKLDRSAWDVLPGEVMLLSWPRRGLSSVVVRAGRVNYGKPLDSAVRVSLLQDIFSLLRPPVTIVPPSDWVDPARPPEPLAMQLFTVPAYFIQNAEIQNSGVVIDDEEALVGALADSVSDDSLDYELMSESVTAYGNTVVTSKGSMTLTPRGDLTVTLPAAATSVLSADLFPSLNEAPRTGGFVFIGYGDDNQEIALVTGRTSSGWTIARGALDTTPRSWASGTPVWSVNPGARVVDTQTIHSSGETVAYRGLDRTTLGLLPYADAPSVTATLNNRANLPLRPANVKVKGTAFGSVAIGGATSFDVTWSIRNRLLEDTQVLAWTEGSIPPEYRQETVVQCFDVTTGDLIVEYGALWLDTSLTFQKTDFDRFTSVRFTVVARRDEDESLYGHSVTLTGFAANPTAPLPPAPPPRTEPPSMVIAPALGAFTCVAGSEVDPDGGSVPTLEFSGQQDNPKAEQVITRVRPVGADTWKLGRFIPLNQEVVHFTQGDLVGLTEYQIQVAYCVKGIVGAWRALPNVSTTRLIVGSVVTIGGETAAEAAEAIRQLREIGQGAVADAFERLRETQEESAEALFVLAAAQDRIQRFVEESAWIEGENVGAYASRRTLEISTDVELALDSLSLLGVRGFGGQSWILDLDTVRVTPTQSMASRLTQILVEAGENTATYVDGLDIVVDLGGVSATQFARLGAETEDGSAFLLDYNHLLVAPGVTLAGRFEETVATAGENAATAIDGIDLVADLGGVTATSFSLLGAETEDGTGFIFNEDTIEVGARGTLGSLIDLLTITDGLDNSAAVLTAITAELTAEGGVVSRLDQLDLDLFGETGSITTLLEITGDLEDGLSAVVGLSIDINGHVAGYKFANDGTTGSLLFLVDQFGFVDPDGGYPIFPISYGADNILRLQQVLIDDATVLGDLIIGTRSIQDFAVTSKAISYNASGQTMTGTTPSTVAQVSKGVPPNSRVELMFQYYADFRVGGGSFIRNTKIVRYHNAIGGTPSPGASFTIYNRDTNSPPITGADYIIGEVPVPYTDFPPNATDGSEATYTYKLVITFNVDGFDAQQTTDCWATAEVIRK